MKTNIDTLSHRKPLKFWGWGYADEELSSDEQGLIRALAGLYAPGGVAEVEAPRLEEFELSKPRLKPPATMAALLSSTPYDRLVHTYGKSYADCARMFLRQAPNTPDLVAFPKNEQDISDIFDWATDNSAAVIPFGGGTSVCGGVECAVGEDYGATISLDLQYLNRVLEIEHQSRAARIQGGIFGPELETALRPHGLTLRHFPQSFEFSTLGGWIATRSGGHYASLYTHIDDFVEATRTLTPQGVMETRRLPGSGAGPSPDRVMIGSEGTLGVITEAWMRLQDRPLFRASAAVTFETLNAAVAAVRALSQAGLFPTNCRLLDAAEVRLNNVGDGKSPTVVLGFESADHPLQAWMQRALELMTDHGGQFDQEAVNRSMTNVDEASGEHRKGAAGAWRDTFIRMPYYRNLSTPLGLILDTFETSITWDRFDDFYAGVKAQVGDAIQRIVGHEATISCRFTHVYPDGPAPYFTFTALGSDQGDLAGALEKWREIKQAANEAVVGLGGTVTHHHAVGRDHRSGYEIQSPALFREAIVAAKHALDPHGVLNPGVLFDPKGKSVGVTGALQDIG
ncbi:MAG: FAD-binding oxidoreductase [Pseudomonadales bacterium]